MLCLNPVYVPNQAKFIDVSTRHRLYVNGRCGKCANCLQSKSAEWSFRSYKEFEDTVNNGHYVYFVTLTYSDKFVPHLRDFPEFSELMPSEDYMCFNREHLQTFHADLRSNLRRLGYVGSYKYFVGCEYGTSERGTHRPHYHLLFFVNCGIDPLEFSKLVSKNWPYGLTDGYPYKNSAYVYSNVFHSLVIGSRRVCNYVTKYVQKSSAYMKQVERRVNKLLWRLADYNPDWFKLDSSKDLRRRLKFLSNQFHLQSTNFGASALNCDFYELYKRGYFLMPNGKGSMYNKIPISQYYHRKICYDKITLDDGLQLWSLKEDKVDLIKLRQDSLFRNTSNRFREDLFHLGISFDSDKLADYYLNFRGRVAAPFDEDLLLGDKLSNVTHYCYSSSSDKRHFGKRFVTNKYLGWKESYIKVDDADFYSLSDFINIYMLRDDSRFLGFEDIIDKIDNFRFSKSFNMQDVFDYKQYLQEKYKILSLY